MLMKKHKGDRQKHTERDEDRQMPHRSEFQSDTRSPSPFLHNEDGSEDAELIKPLHGGGVNISLPRVRTEKSGMQTPPSEGVYTPASLTVFVRHRKGERKKSGESRPFGFLKREKHQRRG